MAGEDHPLHAAWYPKHANDSVASTRLRVFAPIEALAARGHRTRLYEPGIGDRPEVVVFGKRYSTPDYEEALDLQAAGSKVVLDMCDNMLFNESGSALHEAQGKKLKRMLRTADRVTCSTPTLAAIIAREAGLQQMPTVVDDPFERLDLPAYAPGDGPPTILWFGRDGASNAPNGIADISVAAPYLRAMRAERAFRFVVCSNSEESFARHVVPLDLDAEYVPWTLDGFDAVLARAAGVILPFMMNDFVRPKTHNRLSLVLGAGVPAVATMIPSYRDLGAFCYLDDWENGLRAVLAAPSAARAKAAPAREWLDRNLGLATIADQWAAALRF